MNAVGRNLFCFILIVYCVQVALCDELYVSRHHGSDTPYCGRKLDEACKTIAFVIAHARWNDTINIDGTGTSRDPYPCSPLSSQFRGVYVNKSVALRRIGSSEAFIRCSSEREIHFDGRHGSNALVIFLKDLTFLNSHMTVQNCSLGIEGCSFADASSYPNATAVVHFESFGNKLSLTIINSTFRNNYFPCVRVHAVGSRPAVKVYDTEFIENSAIWKSTQGNDDAIFMILFFPGRMPSTTYVQLTNVSFVRNNSPFGGCFYLKEIIGGKVKTTEGVRYKSKCNTHQNTSCDFTGPLHDWKSTSPADGVSVSVENGMFIQNTGGGINIHKVQNIELKIAGVNVHQTHALRSDFGGAITVSDCRLGSISITKSNFTNNSSPLEAGAVLIGGMREYSLHVESCNFIGNTAKNKGSAIYVTTLMAIRATVLIRDVMFMRNILSEPDFIEEVPVGGALAISIADGVYDHVLRVILQGVTFVENKAAYGSSTLYSSSFFQEVTISDSFFLDNSQDKRFAYNWNIAEITAGRLVLNMTKTVISGNHANYRTYLRNITETGQPANFLVGGFLSARINMSSMHYHDNRGGGMFIQLSMGEERNSTFCLQDSQFKNNELFRLEIKTKTNSTLRLERIVFKGNSFLDTSHPSLAILFFSVLGQGHNITIQDAIFENNTHAQNSIVWLRLASDERELGACDVPRWNYHNRVVFKNVSFHNNTAGTSGVLRLRNGWHILSNCKFLNNFGGSIGSNLFLAEGSTKLELSSSSFEQTGELEIPLRGFIYSASSGPLRLSNTTVSFENFQDLGPYFMVTDSSTVEIDNSSIIQCPIGTLRTLNNFSHTHFVSDDACPRGEYLTTSESFIFSCTRCSSGYYSDEPLAKSCFPCPYGGNCTRNIAAKPNFWGFPSLSDPSSVSFEPCPSGYCCPYQNISCPYDKQHYLTSGCSGNRTSILCGQCKRGFSETLFSVQCRPDDECTDKWFWPLALFYSFSFGFFLIWKPSVVVFIKRKLFRMQDVVDATTSGGYVKVVFYFYQMASLVFVSQNREMFLVENYLVLPVVGWFDFRALDSNKGLVCPFHGLTVITKFLFHASQVIAVLFCILVIFVVNGVVNRSCGRSPALPPSGRYLGAVTDGLLLGYSTLTSTVLKMLNCVPIQSTTRFFYDGNIQCWQWWQIICSVFVVIFIVPFIVVLNRGSKLLHNRVISTKQFLCACILPFPFALYWLVTCRKQVNNTADDPRHYTEAGAQTEDKLLSSQILPEFKRSRCDHSPTEDQPLLSQNLQKYERSQCDHSPTEDVLYGPFRTSRDSGNPATIYWESVLIGRRLVLIVLHTFIYLPFIRMVCLSVTCACILAHHLWAKPFKDTRVNHVETASLTALVTMAVINLVEAANDINGGALSDPQRICMTVLHIVEVFLLGVIPVIFLVIVVVALFRQLIYFVYHASKTFWVYVVR